MGSSLLQACEPHVIYGPLYPPHDRVIVQTEVSGAKRHILFYRHSKELRVGITKDQSYSRCHLGRSDLAWNLPVNDYFSIQFSLDEPRDCSVHHTRQSALPRTGGSEDRYALTLLDVQRNAS